MIWIGLGYVWLASSFGYGNFDQGVFRMGGDHGVIIEGGL